VFAHVILKKLDQTYWHTDIVIRSVLPMVIPHVVINPSGLVQALCPTFPAVECRCCLATANQATDYH